MWLPVWGHADQSEVAAGVDRDGKVEGRFFSEKCASNIFPNFLRVSCVMVCVEGTCLHLTALFYTLCSASDVTHLPRV